MSDKYGDYYYWNIVLPMICNIPGLSRDDCRELTYQYLQKIKLFSRYYTLNQIYKAEIPRKTLQKKI